VGALHGDVRVRRYVHQLDRGSPFSFAFIVLIVLAISNLGGTASWTTDVAKVGGWFAILDSFAAGYLGAAILVNVSTGKSLMPLLPTNLWKS
jgi:succinate-acetate transporter protein